VSTFVIGEAHIYDCNISLPVDQRMASFTQAPTCFAKVHYIMPHE